MRSGLLTAIVLAVLAGIAHGGLYTIAWTGELTNAFGTLPVGAQIDGWIVCNTDVPPWQGYIYQVPLSVLGDGNTYAVSRLPWLPIGLAMAVFNDAPEGTNHPDDGLYSAANITDGYLGGLPVKETRWKLADSTRSVFTESSFPTSLDLADFDLATFWFATPPLPAGTSDAGSGVITSLSLTPGYNGPVPIEDPVPLPGAALLGLLGMGMAGMRLRRAA